MLPLDDPASDGGFTLGFALAQMGALAPGVYVCMNGVVFDPDDVKKIEAEGGFAKLAEPEPAAEGRSLEQARHPPVAEGAAAGLARRAVLERSRRQ